MEVADLADEVRGLQELVVKYESVLNRVQADCNVRGEFHGATTDGAAVSDLTQEIAGEMSRTSRSGSPKHVDAAMLRCVHSLPEASQPKQISKVELRISTQAVAVMPPAAGRMCQNNIHERRKKIKKSTNAASRRTFLQRFIDHWFFDIFCAAMIIGNSCVIGHDVQWMTTHTTEPEVSKVMGLFCSVFFFLELVVRVLADGPRFFFYYSENRNWNWFDFFLVAMSFFDILSFSDSGSDASSVGMGIKTIKMLRIVRVLRVFRFFTKLSQLAFMIIDSVKSLVWALIMLGIVIYVFAIFFTHYTAEYTRLQGNGPNAVLIAEHFGSLWTTIFTLFHCMLNGISWYTIPIALSAIPGWTGPFLAVGFVGYLSFTMLAVMNIITGVFVDNAVETARTQREFLVQKEMEVKEQWLSEMRNIFMEMDVDGSGTVSREEILGFVNDERVQYYLTALGLDVDDAERLFVLLDENRDGEIELDQFLSGCLRLKGSARSIDVCSLIHQSRQLCKRIEEIDVLLHDFMGIQNNGSAWLMPPLKHSPKSGFSVQKELTPDKTPPDAACGGKTDADNAYLAGAAQPDASHAQPKPPLVQMRWRSGDFAVRELFEAPTYSIVSFPEGEDVSGLTLDMHSLRLYCYCDGASPCATTGLTKWNLTHGAPQEATATVAARLAVDHPLLAARTSIGVPPPAHVTVVWGISVRQPEWYNLWAQRPHRWQEWEFDPLFQVNDPWVQRAMMGLYDNLSADLHAQPESLDGPWPKAFASWLELRGQSYPSKAFHDDIVPFIAE
ncbi:unnamed protein product, partial [Prorocentrum cordatum]